MLGKQAQPTATRDVTTHDRRNLLHKARGALPCANRGRAAGGVVPVRRERARLERALTAEAFEAVSADPDQLTLFAPNLAGSRPILTILPGPVTVEDGAALQSS